MKTTVAKISLVVLSIAAVVWLGAVNIRAIIGFELLHTGTLEFVAHPDPAAEREIMHLISYASLAVDGGYIITFLSAIIFLWATPLVLRREGWLLMSAILFFLFAPVEFYTISLDVKFISCELFGSPNAGVLRELFIKRFAALAGVPLVAILCYYTILPLAVWRPFRKETAV
jgi:hypothetical protein